MFLLLFLENKISRDEIKTVLAELYNVKAESLVEWEENKPGILIAIDYHTKGFLTSIDFALDDEQLKRSEADTELKLARVLSKRFNTNVLINHPDIDPYKWKLVSHISQNEYVVDQININDDNDVEIRKPLEGI